MNRKQARKGKIVTASIITAITAALALSGIAPARAQSAQSTGNEAAAPIGSPNSINFSEGAEQAIKQAFYGTVSAAKDTGLTAEVKTSLLADDVTQHSTIHVETTEAIVTLTGVVPSIVIARRAGQVAEGVSGVELVRNELKIVPPATASADSSETTGESTTSGTN